MKKHLLILGLLGLFLPAFGQSDEELPSNMAKELQVSLSTLDQARIKSGVLYDLALPVSEPEKFAGTGEKLNTYANWEQQYAEYYQASLNKASLPSLEELRGRIRARMEHGQVPLLVLNYQYDKLLPNAANEKLITIDSVNAQVYDGPDLSRSPYTQGRVFASALPVETYSGSYQVYVGPEFCFGNVPTQDVWLDTGDGAGWLQRPMGSTVTSLWNTGEATGHTGVLSADNVAQPQPQQQVWVYADGAYATTAVQQARTASIAPDVALGLAASRLWGSYPRARAMGWVKWGAGNTSGKFRKPMVFVEGIDFRELRAGTMCFNYAPGSTGPVPLSTFQSASCLFAGSGAGIYRNGEAGWNEMVDYNGEYKALEKLPALRAQLEQQGYDVVYLDFTDGADLIQNNSMVLVELLDYINNPANRTADAQESVVMGASMGGQVARFALAWMEQQNICHNAKLYVSMDSPHRGANIPLGLQYMVDRLADVWIGAGSAREAKSDLLRPASRQMMIYHFDDGAAMSYRNEWQGWQNSAGSYPSLLRRVAVANGNAQASFQPGSWPGMELLSINQSNWQTLATGDAFAYAMPGASSRGNHNVIFRYSKQYSLKWHYRQVSPSTPAYDTSPGSTYRTAGKFRDKNSSLFNGGPDIHTFMPTISVIDAFVAGPVASPNLSYNVAANIVANRPDRTKYAFDAYFAPSTSEPHVQITNGTSSTQTPNSYYSNNVSWIMNELAQSNNGLSLAAPLVGAAYNYGSAYRRLLSSVRVTDGGELHINNGTLFTSGGTATTQGMPTPANFEISSSNCGTRVTLDNGGSMFVGGVAPYTATLTMNRNSLIDLQSTSLLQINAGSVLRIKAGATLVVRAGNRVQVDGQLIVEPGGYICVANPANIVVGTGGVYTVMSGANTFANPALGLGNLACGSVPVTCSTATVAISSVIVSSTPCQAQYRLTATGTNLGSTIRWTIDGYQDPAFDDSNTATVWLEQGYSTVASSVSINNACVSGNVATASKTVTKLFPKCGQMREAEQRISLYPNPSNDYLLVTSKDPARTSASPQNEALDGQPQYDFQAFSVELYDGRGKRVSQQQTQQGELRLDTSKIPNGLYHIKVTQGKEVLEENISIQH
ncbi:T9SS type A sorting domain-containing protein [Hymenobacter lucidus]|uniref:T9SS type A sorting domain-containing protein n=1 Tax=Hymenobacter lucidus TaxID=2880930 RepID=A0ABS8AL91_9BACT|nr:T9SS type A sorting domain-containing protein [Hymenobacter lucidus]MCB2406504.1 T9SS type A sorting domain-containing protein [Hymenobacter lucidus]